MRDRPATALCLTRVDIASVHDVTVTGFNLSGRPRSTLPIREMARADVKRLRDSRMYRMNTWDVVCGDADQGLFVHVFLVLLRGAGFAYPVRDASFRVHHFFALHKERVFGLRTRAPGVSHGGSC